MEIATSLAVTAVSFGVFYAAVHGIVFLWNYDPKAVLAERAKTWRDHSQDWQRRSE